MINSVHLHLILVHIPIIIFPLAVLLLLISYFKPNNSIRSLACWLVIAACLLAIPAYLAGESSEELVEKIPGILESAIEKHEDFALFALILASVSAVFALFTLLSQTRFTSIQAIKPFLLLLILSTFTSISLAWVGFQGGKIRHSEAFSMTKYSISETDKVEDRD